MWTLCLKRILQKIALVKFVRLDYSSQDEVRFLSLINFDSITTSALNCMIVNLLLSAQTDAKRSETIVYKRMKTSSLIVM